MAKEGAGPCVSGLADGSVPFFPPLPLESNVKEREGGEEGVVGRERRECERGREIMLKMPLCVPLVQLRSVEKGIALVPFASPHSFSGGLQASLYCEKTNPSLLPSHFPSVSI